MARNDFVDNLVYTDIRSDAATKNDRHALRVPGMTIDPWIAVQIVVGALVAGFIQGVSGFAFGLIATSLWAWTIEPQLVVPTVIFGSILGQLISIQSVRKSIQLRRVAPFLLGGAVGVPIGAALLPHLDVDVFRFVVGAVLVAYSAIVLLGARLPDVSGAGRGGDFALSVVAGTMGGASALSGPPITLWCAMRQWDKDDQRATYQTVFIGTHTLTLASYLASGLLTLHSVGLFGLVAPPILLSSWIGSRWYRGMSGATFTRALFLVLLFSGLTLVSASSHHLLRFAGR